MLITMEFLHDVACEILHVVFCISCQSHQSNLVLQRKFVINYCLAPCTVITSLEKKSVGHESAKLGKNISCIQTF